MLEYTISNILNLTLRNNNIYLVPYPICIKIIASNRILLQQHNVKNIFKRLFFMKLRFYKQHTVAFLNYINLSGYYMILVLRTTKFLQSLLITTST